MEVEGSTNNDISNTDAPGTAVINEVPQPESAPRQATGLSIDYCARGLVAISSLFLGPTLLGLARDACAASGDDDTDSENSSSSGQCRIYGFRSSSLLSNIAVVSGLLGPLAMIFAGAVADHTRHRKRVATISAIVLALVKGIQVVVGTNTWFLVAVLQPISTLLYNIHATASFAFTSTNDPDGRDRYHAILFNSMLIFLLLIFVAAVIWDMDNVGTARMSLGVASGTSLAGFAVAWLCFLKPRPALGHLAPGQSLWTVGFVKVFDTSRRIVEQRRALLWALLAVMLNEAAVRGFTIAITYLTEILDMSSAEIGAIYFVVLIAGIPGRSLGSSLSEWLGSAVRLAMACDVGFVVTIASAPFYLQGPSDKGAAFVFAALWGLATGCLRQATLLMNLLPDEGAGFMGVLMHDTTLATSALSWLPPLVFSALNEEGASMSWGLGSLNLFFLLAVLCLLRIGNLQEALPITPVFVSSDEDPESISGSGGNSACQGTGDLVGGDGRQDAREAG